MEKPKPTKRNYLPGIAHKETPGGTEYRFMIGNRIVSRHKTEAEARAAFDAYVRGA